ncbi:T9SS type A sorting domain-containing protein [Pontimicrobium sp. SW4]|uniref:T9SS type A sorting domain-containing protein n=1 Tax=Pontimicrobium sp. SW4 TaxID=3153519 RepID=A0AAU7BWI8_9FLAO
MNNFTKCCSSFGRLQNKGKSTLMLFMFLALTSLSYAQGTGANNTGGGEELGPVNGCMHEVPAMKSVSELMAPGYFDGFFDACHDSSEEFQIHPVAAQQGVDGEWGVATGFAKGSTHCSWTYYYVYSVKCAGEVTPFTVKYNGGDATAPWVPKQNKAAYNALIADKLDLDLCFDNRPIAPTANEIAALYTDNCEHVKVSGELVSKRTKTKNDDCGWVEIHVYTVKDYCDDNAFEFSITYSGSDQSEPVFNEKAIEGLKDITVDCDKIPDAVAIPYTDNCAPSGKAKLHEEVSTIVEGQECAGGIIERWWKATDECGNNAWHKQTITVRPAKQAVFNQPQDMSISCEDRNNFEGLIPDLYYSNGMTGACEISGLAKPEYTAPDSNCASFEVTYSFTDNCGRTINESMTVTIFDNVNPSVLNAAEDLTVECDGEGNIEDYNNWIATNANASAQDNCTATEDLVWTNNAASQPMSDDCGATGQKTVIFTVTDSCGNQSKTYATFKIVDTKDPETTPAYNKTVVCDGEGNVDQFQTWLDNNGDATAKDDCSGVTWTNDFPGDPKHKDFDIRDYLKESCGEGSYTGYINVVFTATDACGNDVDLPATFTIEDSIAPEVTPASDMTVECDSSIPDYWKENTDYDQADLDAQGGGAYPGTNYHAWLTWLGNNGGATATDGCSGVYWKFRYRVYGNSCDTEYRTTFYAYDQCGNVSTTTASFHVVDTNSPAIGNEAQDLIVECGQEHDCPTSTEGCYSPFLHWLHTNGGAEAMDMCDKDLTWSNDWNGKELTDECGNTGRITVTFTVTDNCGLSSSTAAEYRIVDTIAPSLDIPEDVVLELDEKCEADITPANTGMAYGRDACSSVTITKTDVEDKQACVTTIIRTWKATDDCGNVTTKDQKITLIDKLAPVYTGNVGQFNMSNVDACSAPAAPAEQSIADQFTDACGHVIATLVNTITISDDTCDWAVQFVYEVADNCGNVYDGTVKVTYWGSDQTAPNLIDGEKLPEGASGINACLADALAANPAVEDHAIEKIFEDNCGGKVSAKSELTVTEDACKWAFHYTYTVTDECGNEYDFKQEFSGEDNTAPELIGTIPSDMSDLDACIDSYEGPTEAEIAALFHEECGLSVVKTTHRTGSNCGNGWINSFEYTVSDACGNAYPPFKIIYQGSDQSAPEWTFDWKNWIDNSVSGVCPDDASVSLEVGDTFNQYVTYDFNGFLVNLYANPAVTDNCTADADIVIEVVSKETTSNGCESNIVLGLVARDNCGNASEVYYKGHKTADTVAPVVDAPSTSWTPWETDFSNTIDLGHNPAGFFNGGDPNWVVAYAAYDELPATDNCNNTVQSIVGGTIYGFSPVATNTGYVRQFVLRLDYSVADTCGNTADTVSVFWSYTADVPGTNGARTSSPELEQVEQEGGAPSSANDGDDVSLDFQAYPVPFNKDVTVKYMFEFDTNVTVEVYDTRGLLVMSKTAAYSAGTDATMPLSINGADQMYYVKLITNKGTVTKKILASKL